MAGARCTTNTTYVTPRAHYRANIETDDTSPTDVSIPILDTRIDYDKVGTSSQRGESAQINLAILLADSDGLTSTIPEVTVELWLKAEIEMVAYDAPSAVTIDPTPSTGEWVCVGYTSVDRSTLWVVKDIPPGQYKVLVTDIAAGTSVSIREQHAY